MPAAAKRAHFDPAAKDRRLMIAKIHVAKKELMLSDDDYRAVLVRVTGRSSSADCSLAELRAILSEFKSKGFQAKKATRVADHPAAQKARALWISLYHLGAIHDASESALEAFARRQLKVARLQWADQGQSYKLIEALKAIAERHGWSQRVPAHQGIRPPKADAVLRIVKCRLVDRLRELLIEHAGVPADWPIEIVAERIGGVDREDRVHAWSLGDLDILARAMGDKLRECR